MIEWGSNIAGKSLHGYSDIDQIILILFTQFAQPEYHNLTSYHNLTQSNIQKCFLQNLQFVSYDKN